MLRWLTPLEVLAVLLALGRGVTAQLTGATCEAGFDWAFNSRGQSPCLMAAYLAGECLSSPSDSYIDALDPDHHYTLPQSAADNCYCNTVFYSILSACASCQGDESLPWTTWTTNCTNSYVDVFPETIPVGTAVPAWAYLDVTTSNDWNLTTAKNYAAQNKTEITNPSSTSSTSSTSMSSTSSGSASPTATTAPTTHTSKKTNVGAIVGGVVGGVCGAVLLLLALLFWYRRRKAQRRPPSAQFRQPSPVLIAAPWTPDAEKRFSPGPTSPVSIGRIYNPDDPSTFPDAQPPVNSIYSQSTRGSAVFSAQNGYQPAGIRYNGPAEL